MEHWWVIFELSDGSYLVAFKWLHTGICLHHLSNWNQANSSTWTGGAEIRNLDTVKHNKYGSYSRSAKSIL